MADSYPLLIRSKPGIKRDGTLFEGDFYVDGQWVRFQRGLPRKMGGYKKIATLQETSRGIHVHPSNGSQYIHTGGKQYLYQIQTDAFGNVLYANDRTPSGFTASDYNSWTLGVMFDAVSTKSTIIAHASQNLVNMDNEVATPIYYGEVTASSALTTTSQSVCGGFVVVHPYLFKFCKGGYVAWSVPNKPADFSNTGSGEARVAGTKIVKGLPLRGTGAGPAALLWSLDSLIQVVKTDSAAIFTFNTVTDQTSILSPNSVIEYDGMYFWIGVDRFLVFNGVVRELPNDMNINYFFENLNLAYRHKVFAFKVPRFGEIWWCYPRGSATECSHAVIYNVRENSWYDTALPGAGRSAGSHANLYTKPFMAEGTTLWQHETGTDEVGGTGALPIRSYFETAEFTLLSQETPSLSSLKVERIEPDFVQKGPMTIQVKGRANARAPEDYSEVQTAPEIATRADQQTVTFRGVRRLMRFRFESNKIGGDYQMGQCYAHIAPADGRVTS